MYLTENYNIKVNVIGVLSLSSEQNVQNAKWALHAECFNRRMYNPHNEQTQNEHHRQNVQIAEYTST